VPRTSTREFTYFCSSLCWPPISTNELPLALPEALDPEPDADAPVPVDPVPVEPVPVEPVPVEPVPAVDPVPAVEPVPLVLPVEPLADPLPPAPLLIRAFVRMNPLLEADVPLAVPLVPAVPVLPVPDVVPPAVCDPLVKQPVTVTVCPLRPGCDDLSWLVCCAPTLTAAANVHAIMVPKTYVRFMLLISCQLRIAKTSPSAEGCADRRKLCVSMPLSCGGVPCIA
jgi:hypothetical protein